jgi:uncharacterized protein
MKPLVATDFYKYIQCPHWPYWDLYGDPKDKRDETDEEIMRKQDGLDHERQIVAELFGEAETVTGKGETGAEATLALMREGASLIYQGTLKDGEWEGRPDILERQEGKSRFGDWYYVPVDVKRSHELKKEHKAQLMFYAVLLERIQGRFPSHPAIVNGDGERIGFDAEQFESEFREMIRDLERIREGERPAPVYRKACEDTSPWGVACRRLAEETEDIALLYNVDMRKLRALRSLGVHTIHDAARLVPEALEGQAPGLTLRGLEAIRRQAISLTTESVLIREPFVDPTEGLEIHFDIESHPPSDTDYLYGFWMEGKYHAIVSERPEDERRLWSDFLAWIRTLPETYTVWHYAAYEPVRLHQLARRYQTEGDPYLMKFVNSFKDLKDYAADTAVFPVYFYSLKKIASFLGFSWKGDVKGGGASVTAYEDWLETGKRATLDAIVQYNREDVQATAHILDWMRRYARTREEFGPPYPWTT